MVRTARRAVRPVPLDNTARPVVAPLPNLRFPIYEAAATGEAAKSDAPAVSVRSAA